MSHFLSARAREGECVREMKTGNIVTAVVLIIVMGTAAYQWKTMVQSEMHVAQRNR